MWIDLDAFIQWLHRMGIHVPGQAAHDVGAVVDRTGQTIQAATAHMGTTQLLALAAALGWASGFRLYAVVFMVGALGATGWVTLPPDLQMLGHPVVLLVSGSLMLVEFFADKIPWIDSVWDTVHGLIRIPGGALLAAGVFGGDSGTTELLAGLMGGSLAATSYATKASARMAINTSPEPASNWLASFFEDGLAVVVVWLALQHPVWFGVVLILMLVISVILLVVLYRFLRLVWRRVSAVVAGH